MSMRVFSGWFILGWTGRQTQAWLATDDQTGSAAAWYRLELSDRDNRDIASLSMRVGRDKRRAGLGGSLLRHAARRAHAEGRSLLTWMTRTQTPGSPFAAAVGARPGLVEVDRVLDVAAIPAGRLAELRAQAGPAAAGYALISWQGPAPADQVDQVTAVNSAMADAPREPGTEPERWDAARIRAAEARVALQGLRYYSVAARCDATGELAALTQLGVDPSYPEWGFQELTAVTRSHRGHRLGLLSKVAMLELIAEREPQITRIITGNSESNQHMIAINEALGFRVLHRWMNWQLNVTDVLGRPDEADVAAWPAGDRQATVLTAS